MRPDEQLLLLANSNAGTHHDLSLVIFFVSSNPVTKSIPVILVIWSLWFVQRAGTYPCRAAVLATLTIAILEIVVGCILAIVLPFSPRSIQTADLELHLDGFVRRGMFEGMISFPSDHAVLFAALCTGNILMNRTAGALIGLYCVHVVLLPRIIFGLHRPSDILVGICVGAFLALATFGRSRDRCRKEGCRA